MKKLFFKIVFGLGLFLLMTFLFSSCKNKEKACKLNIDKTEITLSLTGKKSEKISIKTKCNWTIEAPGLSPNIGLPGASTSWYLVDYFMGEGDALLEITLNDFNESFNPEIPQSTELSIVGNHNKAIIALKYNPKDALSE